MWVRGLKRVGYPVADWSREVAPYVGAWIETYVEPRATAWNSSHPMWVRGLKPTLPLEVASVAPSHPMWVRGLKHHQDRQTGLPARVAPYVGAWIETSWTR